MTLAALKNGVKTSAVVFPLLLLRHVSCWLTYYAFPRRTSRL